MDFEILKKSESSSLRRGVISTYCGNIDTPVFMPVGTVGTVKSVAPWELRELGAEIILGNTYHLFLRPGEKLIEKFGGLSKWSGWGGPILTDSGGYQVFSLREKKIKNPCLAGRQEKSKIKIKEKDLFDNSELVKITDDGVEFKSYLDGTKHFFTPEKVIDIQLALGSDIIMPLDVCPSSIAHREEIENAVEISIKWLVRSKLHLERKFQITRNKSQTNLKSLPCRTSASSVESQAGQTSNLKPALFGIIQGGIDKKLRKYCAEEMIKLDLPGYAIGGLAVGESQKEMLEMVGFLDKILPKNKPRYLMGVGTPDDILKATKLGVDMFDCVLPTRMARHGTAYVKLKVKSQKSKVDGRYLFEEINLLNSKFREDKNLIDKNCQCPTCRAPQKSNSFCEIPRSEAEGDKNNFSLAYLSHLIREKEILGVRLLTLHNLHLYLNLMKEIRESI
ncbi:MAG: queuine tRNA-ribosyltransferase [Candidatus Berkelbacteria bacterium Athens1014_28]|uniref:Queuine tRNA-ribosyltransferase n=1 Tax=Candidatus Berkelbacteria bacterium Athens1014_28 TaxID=2017145 RepID=A0A554LLK4_9BACT|nr:MAG: queuine tRNA-ribosyltransferase [Candidatus Berkelbacteria bacterium Athens1014_28]